MKMKTERAENQDYDLVFWDLLNTFESLGAEFRTAKFDWNKIADPGKRGLIKLIHEIALNLPLDETHNLLPPNFPMLSDERKQSVLRDIGIFVYRTLGDNEQKNNGAADMAMQKSNFRHLSDDVYRAQKGKNREETDLMEQLMKVEGDLVLQYADNMTDRDAVIVAAVCLRTSPSWQLDGFQVSQLLNYFPKGKPAGGRGTARIDGLSDEHAASLIKEVEEYLHIFRKLKSRLQKKGADLPKNNWKFESGTALAAIRIKTHIDKCSDSSTVKDAIQDSQNELETEKHPIPERLDSLTGLLKVVEENPHIDAVSFDLMDTLVYWRGHTVDRREDYYVKAIKIINNYGIDLSLDEFKKLRGYLDTNKKTVDGIWKQKRKEATEEGLEFSFKHIIRIILDKACRMKNKKLSDAAMDRLCADLQRVYVDTECATIALMPGAKETLDELKKSGVKIALLSNAVEDLHSIRKYLRAVGIEDYFDAVMVSSEAGFQKGTKTTNFYESLENELGITGSRIIHIGDNLHADFIGARKAGINGIHFLKSRQIKEIVKKSRIPSEDYPRAKENIADKNLIGHRREQLDKIMDSEGIPEAERAELKEAAMRMYEIARDIYVPAVMGFGVDLLRNLKKDPKKVNICLGRDSFTAYIIQQMLMRYYKDEFGDIDRERVQYLPVSRKLAGGGDRDSQLWRALMALEHPEIITFDEKKLRQHLASRHFDDYEHICLVDHGISGSTQDRLQELFPNKDIEGRYLLSRVGRSKQKKHGYFVGIQNKEHRRFYDGPNRSKFGDRYKIFRRGNNVRVMEDFFSGVTTSAEFFTGEEKNLRGRKFVKTNQRKLGRTSEEKRRKIVKLMAIYATHDAVKMYGRDALNSKTADEMKKIDRLKEWLESVTERGSYRLAWIGEDGKLTPRAQTDAQTNVDARLVKMLYRYK